MDAFQYFGTLIITNNADCTKNRARLGKEHALATSLKKIWKTNITVDTKVPLLGVLIWPVATYGSGRWTRKTSDESSIKAFEMKKNYHRFARDNRKQKQKTEFFCFGYYFVFYYAVVLQVHPILTSRLS